MISTPSRLTVQLTNYWIPSTDCPSSWAEYNADHPGERAIKLTGGQSIILKEAFLAATQMEGCGRIRGGCLCYADGEWTLLPADRFPWGVDARGLPLVPFASIAVDLSVIPLGSVWRLDPDDVPMRKADGSEWDGIVTAADTGGAIKGEHVDLFVGHKSDRIDGDQPTPWIVRLDRMS